MQPMSTDEAHEQQHVGRRTKVFQHLLLLLLLFLLLLLQLWRVPALLWMNVGNILMSFPDAVLAEFIVGLPTMPSSFHGLK